MLVLRWLSAILILPGTGVVFVPALLLWSTLDRPWAAAIPNVTDWRFGVPIAIAAVGLFFGCWTCSLFLFHGKGTAAPWDPPREFVARGPYRHVRNPMITGVLLMIAGETLFFWSWPIAVWFAVFLIGNLLYIPLVEEKGLERRFGATYAEYKRHVPRWIPRLTPWNPES